MHCHEICKRTQQLIEVWHFVRFNRWGDSRYPDGKQSGRYQHESSASSIYKRNIIPVSRNLDHPYKEFEQPHAYYHLNSNENRCMSLENEKMSSELEGGRLETLQRDPRRASQDTTRTGHSGRWRKTLEESRKRNLKMPHSLRRALSTNWLFAVEHSKTK